MRKMILAFIILLLTTTASLSAYAQSSDKKEVEKPKTTVDVWLQAIPGVPQTENPPIIVMEESTDNVEAKETPAQIETRILDLERRLIEAFGNRDSAVLKQLLADDFMPAGANLTESQSEKNRFIEWTVKNSELKTYAAEKIKVRVYSATAAIVTTYYKQKKVIAGVSADVDFTATDVWVKRKKRWQAVSHHVTELPKIAPTVSRPTQAKQSP